jgi:hypothetical protein
MLALIVGAVILVALVVGVCLWRVYPAARLPPRERDPPPIPRPPSPRPPSPRQPPPGAPMGP